MKLFNFFEIFFLYETESIVSKLLTVQSFSYQL